MVSQSLKIVIPMAGYGTRLRPITWSRPKQLIRMADKMVIDHVLDTFSTLPDTFHPEFIFIVGYLGHKIEQYMHEVHPDLEVIYVQQNEMRGQAHGISLARDYLDGPMLMIFGDTLIDTEFSFLSNEAAGAVTWVKAVPDPRRFGVAGVGKDGWVTHLVEKPKDMDNNLVLVGCYYFESSRDLLQAIDEQMQRNIALKNEFFLADAVNIMLEHGLRMRVEPVETWLDAGTPEDILSTNRYLLEHGHANTSDVPTGDTSILVPPVFIHPTASIRGSVIGPNTSIGANCKVESCIIRDSVIEDCTEVTNAVLERSLVGQEVHMNRQPGILIVGDHTELNV